jgi:hypothetical protein
MLVSELIQLLQAFPQDLLVAFDLHSEHCLLEPRDIRIATHCRPRKDGWVHNKRPDKPAQDYLMFPGN